MVIRAPSADAPPEPSTPPVAPRTSRPSRNIDVGLGLAALGGACAALSLLFPWWELSFRTVVLAEGAIDAITAPTGLVGIAGAWVLLLALAYDNARPGGSTGTMVASAAATIVVLAGLAAVFAPNAAAGVSEPMNVRPAFGAWLALAGGFIGLAGCGLMWVKRR